jgi:hypothetical protein
LPTFLPPPSTRYYRIEGRPILLGITELKVFKFHSARYYRRERRPRLFVSPVAGRPCWSLSIVDNTQLLYRLNSQCRLIPRTFLPRVPLLFLVQPAKERIQMMFILGFPSMPCPTPMTRECELAVATILFIYLIYHSSCSMRVADVRALINLPASSVVSIPSSIIII